jgi:N-acetylmuramoyl-L-alanine amidase
MKRIAFLMAALGAALFIFGGRGRAADGNFPIYFENTKIVVKAETMNQTTYLPLREIIESMGLPYTDALALETLTVRSGASRLIASRNSVLMSLNDQIVSLSNPVLRENNRWLGPIDFFSRGLSRLTGTQFRYRPGTSRIFAGNVEAPELVMNAQGLGPLTRLTIRCTMPINLDLRRDEQNNRATLMIGRAPVDPLRERLDYKDRMVNSIAFDDSDGTPKIVLDLTKETTDITLTSNDNNRLFFVDLKTKPDPKTKPEAITESGAPAPGPAVPGARVDAPQPGRRVRVIVIDPGHGGMDTGVITSALAEKDLTLGLARKLRSALQTQLGATVLLTRDSDIAMDNEARSAVANNNQANLFISLHAGYSPNTLDSSSSVFVMKEDFGESFAPAKAAHDTLFLPWYLGYRTNRQGSARAAKILQEELIKTISGSQFPVRTAPLALLSSVTMPSLLLEIGNLNNPVNAQTLTESEFQNRLVGTIVDAIRRFSQTQQPSAN